MADIDIKVTDKNGVKLLTNGKIMRGDISVTLDESILPSGTLDITENGIYNIEEYENVNVNVEQEFIDSKKAVPNTGYVENVYFNISLSIEEVNSLLDELTYVQTNLVSSPICPLLVTNDGSIVIFAGKQGSTYEITIVTDIENQVYKYVYHSSEGFIMSSYNVSKEVVNSFMSLEVGTENEKLKELFYIAKEDEQVIIEDKKVVPNNAYVDKIYFNTNLSIEEVVNILNNIEIDFTGVLGYYEDDYGLFASIISADETMVYMAVKLQGIWGILKANTNEFIFISQEFPSLNINWKGWYSKFSGVVEVNNILIPYLDEEKTFPLGNQNEKLKELFYIVKSKKLEGTYDGSSVEVTENGSIDIASLIENDKKIPFEVVVNVEGSGVNKLKYLLDYTKSTEYMFYNNTTITDLTGHLEYNDTENVTKMSSMFNGCSNLIRIPNFNTNNVKVFTEMFNGCTSLQSVPALNVSKSTTVKGLNLMFDYCSSLTSILVYGMRAAFQILDSILLDEEALVTIGSNCQVLTMTKVWTLAEELLAKIENTYVKKTGVELYEGITCDPCVICESTDEGAMLFIDYMSEKGWTLA